MKTCGNNSKKKEKKEKKRKKNFAKHSMTCSALPQVKKHWDVFSFLSQVCSVSWSLFCLACHVTMH